MIKRMTPNDDLMRPTVKNIFHTVLWNKIACTILKQDKVVHHRWYADDVLFESIEYLSTFGAYINTCHPKTSFSFEQEKDGELSFLNAEAFWQQGTFVGLVVKVINSESRGLVFKTTGWLQG